MGTADWGFQGTEYRLRWDGASATGNLAWGDRLRMPVFFPLFSAAPHTARGPDGLRSLKRPAARRLRCWARPGGLLAPAMSPSPGPLEGVLCLASPSDEVSPVLSARISCGPDRVVFAAELENRTPLDLRLHALAPLAGSILFGQGSPAVSDWRFYKMASNTTVPSGSLALDGSERGLGIRRIPTRLIPGPLKRMFLLPDEEVCFRAGIFSSQWFTLLVHRESGAAMLAGFTGVDRHFSTLRLDARSSCFQAAAQGEGCRLAPGQRFTAHPLTLLFGKSASECVERYLDELAGPCRPRLDSVSLWGSWYTGFYDRFRWEDLRDNMDAAARAPERIEVFQLDDGYQKSVGDWEESLACLPEGLEGFARRVLDSGMRPGIWVAPFAASGRSAVCRDHPEWLVKGPSGKPVRAGFMAGRFRLRPYYALDLSRPEVVAWIEKLFRTLAGWGFSLFKLDFLAAGTVPGERFNPAITSAEGYRNALRAIRRAVGDGVVLGALAPQLSGIGVVDVQRVGTDSSFGGNAWQTRAQRWLGDGITPGVRNNLRNNFTRVFFGGRLWVNDCDAILHGGLSPTEQETHQTANLLLGGVFQVGFDLRKAGYPWESIARLRSYRPWSRIVPDLFETDFPEEAMIGALDPQGGDVLLYLLINPSDRTRIKVLRDPAGFFQGLEPLWDRARDVCNGAPFFARPGETITLPPRGSRLVEVPLGRG